MPKLQDLNTNELAAALCRIAPHVEAIGKDEAISSMITGGKVKRGESGLQRLAGMFGSLVPVLLDKHKADTFAILSVLTGKSVQEIERQNGMLTIREMKNVFDKDLMEFFKSST